MSTDFQRRALVPITYLPSTVSRGAPLDSGDRSASNSRYDSGQSFTFPIPPQNAIIESMMLTCFVCITDSKGFEVSYAFNQNAGTVSIDGRAGALGLFDIVMYRGSTQTILASKLNVARSLEATSLSKHQEDLIGHTNGIYVSPHFDDSSVDLSSVPNGAFEREVPFKGLKPVYFNPPIGVLTAGKGLNLANSGGLNITFTVQNAFNLLRSYFRGQGFPDGAQSDYVINPIQTAYNRVKINNPRIGTTGNDYSISILCPKLIVLLKSIESAASVEDNFTFPEVNLLFIQQPASLKQSYNFTLPPSIIEDFLFSLNYKNPDGNLIYGQNFNNGAQTLDFNFYLNGSLQTFAYPTIAYPVGEQRYSAIGNAFVDALSMNVPDQYNFQSISEGKFLKVTTSGAGTGTSFNNTGVAVRITYNPLVKSAAVLPFMPNQYNNIGVQTNQSYANGLNAISFGPDFKCRFCVYSGSEDFFFGQRWAEIANKGTLNIVDESYAELQTPNFCYVGAYAPSANFNTLVITDQLFTLTMNPAATVTLPVAPVPVSIPECLIFRTTASVSPIQFTQEVTVPSRLLPDPPPNSLQYEFILPVSGFIQEVYLNLTPKIVLEPGMLDVCEGWGQICVVDQLNFVAAANGPGNGQMFSVFNNTPYTNAINGNPILCAQLGTLTPYGVQAGAANGYTPQLLSYTGVAAYCAANSLGVTVTPYVDLRGFYLGYTPVSRNKSLHNQFSYSSILGAMTLIRGIDVSFPTGVVATFPNVQDQAFLENLIGDPLLPNLQQSLLLNDYNVKCLDSNSLRDVHNRFHHHKYNKRMSIFPVSRPGSSTQEKLRSDWPSYAQHMLRIPLNHPVIRMLQNTPLSPNLRITMVITFDKRTGLAFAQVSAGLGCGVSTEADVKQFALGITGGVCPVNAGPVSSVHLGSIGLPLMTNFDWTITHLSATMNMAFFSPSSQRVALERFNATGISQTFTLVDCQNRLKTNDTFFDVGNNVLDEINVSTQISIANQNVTSCSLLHRFLFRDEFGDFTLFKEPLAYGKDVALYNVAGNNGPDSLPARALYPYVPTEVARKSNQSQPAVVLGTLYHVPYFGARLQIPPYISCRRGGLAYSVPYAIQKSTTWNDLALQGYEPLCTYTAFGDGISIYPDLMLGTSAANQIMYAMLKGRVLFAQPEDVDFNVYRTLYYPEVHNLPSSWQYSIPNVNIPNPNNVIGILSPSMNFGWLNTSAYAYANNDFLNRCPIFQDDDFLPTIRGNVPLYGGVPLLPSLYVTYIVLPPDFDNTVYFEVKSNNIVIKKNQSTINWLSGSPVLGDTSSLKAIYRTDITTVFLASQIFQAMLTDVPSIIRSYAFRRNESITYSPYNAAVRQDFPAGYSIMS